MCHFITGTLPAGADVEAVRQLAERAGRAWHPIRESLALERLQPGETYYFTTPKMCDCGTALGRMAGAAMADQRRKIRGMERKGWSKAKIDRWVADRNKSIDRNEVDAWLGFLTTALSTGVASGIGLMLHFYSGSIDNETFDFGRQEVPVADIDADFLLGMEEDRLYVFV